MRNDADRDEIVVLFFLGCLLNPGCKNVIIGDACCATYQPIQASLGPREMAEKEKKKGRKI